MNKYSLFSYSASYSNRNTQKLFTPFCGEFKYSKIKEKNLFNPINHSIQLTIQSINQLTSCKQLPLHNDPKVQSSSPKFGFQIKNNENHYFLFAFCLKSQNLDPFFKWISRHFFRGFLGPLF